jgi:hypothetical protein
MGVRIPGRLIDWLGGVAALLVITTVICLFSRPDWNRLPDRLSLRARPGTELGEADPAGRDTPPPSGILKPSVNDAKAYQGYTLIAPTTSTKTFLIDMDGRIVHAWNSESTPALGAYLLDDGHLLRTGPLPREQQPFGGAGMGGRLQEFTWEGELVWDFKYFNDKQLPHHDVTKLPNGNILMVVWDRKTSAEAIATGRKPDSVRDGQLMADGILEIKPTGQTTGEVVWEWHVWDHLIQEQDKTRANYGAVASHPELIDVNFGDGILAPLLANKDDADKLRAIGYLGGPGTPGGPGAPIAADWTHINSVAYNADRDEIMVSVHGFNEIWIIDHGTTRTEAAEHSGGRRGKGGDLLYRWGNPKAYRSGTSSDQRLFGQHNAHWIPKGLPGEGHVLVFNNGTGRPDGAYSSVDEIVLPVDAEGRYTRKPGLPFGPARPQWSFTAPRKTSFYSMMVSGAQRLPNGNTLICSGMNGTLLEATSEKDIVWKYITPAIADDRAGRIGFSAFPPRPCEILPGQMRHIAHLTEEQRKNLEALQQKVDTVVNTLFTEEQKKQLKAAWDAPGGPGKLERFHATFRPGQILPPFLQDLLRLSAEQEMKLEELQKQVDKELVALLTDKQREQLQAGSGLPGQPFSYGGFGTGLFRGERYGVAHPALVGRDLTPGSSLK